MRFVLVINNYNIHTLLLMKQQALDKYFSSVWQSNVKQYQYTGLTLADRVNNNESVIDVGCGDNLFKPLIKNIVGVDPANDQADSMTAIEDYQTDQRFDVAFCLGSINFGDHDHIEHQIKCVVALLKTPSRIYWRCNPGRHDHGNQECKKIDFYPWDLKKHNKFSQQFGYVITEYKQDTNNRIFCEWSSKPNI